MARRAIRIGRIFGIELVLDTSWIFVLGLVVWGLTSVVQSWHPLWTTGTVLSVAVVTAFALFASVLFHELAHALVAKLYGLPVRDITLHMLGGAANIGREPPSPSAELVIAIVGPIASVALGFGMLALASLMTGGAPVDASALSPTATLLVWLGPVNLVIGAFNLLPGFPMDGGRILRAIIWKATGSLRTATRWSTRGGGVVGLGLIAMGAAMAVGAKIPFFGTGLASGIWLAFIGMFLRGAAKSHQLRTDTADALAGVRVENLMRAVPLPAADERIARQIMSTSDKVPTVAPSDSAFDALLALDASGLPGLPVVERGAVVGILFARDFVHAPA